MQATVNILWLLVATKFIAAKNETIFKLNIITHRNAPYTESGFFDDGGMISFGYTELLIPALQRLCGYENYSFAYETREAINQILLNGSLLLAESDSSNQTGLTRHVYVVGPLPYLPLSSRYTDFVEYVQFAGSPGVAAVMNLEEITLMKRVLQAVRDSELVLFLMVSLAVMSGVSMWLIERWDRKTDFDRRFSYGLFDGFWWSMVTLTTTGYGDKIPRSFAGKVLACLWMLCGVVLCSNLTSILTESMSDIQLDITNEKVAVLNKSIEMELAYWSLKAKSFVGWSCTVCKEKRMCVRGYPEENDLLPNYRKFQKKNSYEECLESVRRGDTYMALLDYNVAATRQTHLGEDRMTVTKVFDLPFPLNLYVLKTAGTDQFVNEKLFPCFDKYLPRYSKNVMQAVAPLLTVKRVHRPKIVEFLQTNQEPWGYVVLGLIAVAVLFLTFGCLLRFWKFYRIKTAPKEGSKQLPIRMSELSTKLDGKLKQFKEELVHEIQAMRYEKND